MSSRGTAHPRSRGEHTLGDSNRYLEIGSSPLARGTPSTRQFVAADERLIPARAGNTNLGNLLGLPVAAHPRSRGEHLCPNFTPRFRPGSSPLARGTPVNSPAFYAVKRLIPARAGNTHRYPAPSDSCPAHPRSRGEHFMTLPTLLTDPGSSPLARGTHRVVLLRYFCTRLIPARAGNTWLRFSFQHTPAAHPRSRGEHGILRLRRLLVCGSSPLARGTRRFLCPATSYGRLIPARAGNTLRPIRRRHARSAHPRSRGEHRKRHVRFHLTYGSSPLARGTQTGG